MRILGIDPGYAIVGWGCVRFERARFTPLDFGAVTTQADWAFSDRLAYIYDATVQLLKRFFPTRCRLKNCFFRTTKKPPST